MLIALLAVLGVNLWVIALVVAGVLSRRRWISQRPGAFRGAIRVVDGNVHGLSGKWKRGYGRWIRDVLVWTKTPLLLRNQLLAVDALAADVRAGEPGEVRRLGKHPAVVPLTVDGGARIEVAAAETSRERARGPFATDAEGRHSRPRP